MKTHHNPRIALTVFEGKLTVCLSDELLLQCPNGFPGSKTVVHTEVSTQTRLSIEVVVVEGTAAEDVGIAVAIETVGGVGVGVQVAESGEAAVAVVAGGETVVVGVEIICREVDDLAESMSLFIVHLPHILILV